MITMPDGLVLPSSTEWRLVGNTMAFVSPFSGHAQTARLAAPRWAASWEYPEWKRAESAEIEAFLASLEDAGGRFTTHRHDRPQPRAGHPGGAPVVGGGVVAGNRLATQGWPLSTLVLQRGDMLGADGLLLMATADATSDSSGMVELAVAPTMRRAPTDGATIVLDKPTVTMALVDDDQIAIRARGSLTSLAFSAVEVLTSATEAAAPYLMRVGWDGADGYGYGAPSQPWTDHGTLSPDTLSGHTIVYYAADITNGVHALALTPTEIANVSRILARFSGGTAVLDWASANNRYQGTDLALAQWLRDQYTGTGGPYTIAMELIPQ